MAGYDVLRCVLAGPKELPMAGHLLIRLHAGLEGDCIARRDAMRRVPVGRGGRHLGFNIEKSREFRATSTCLRVQRANSQAGFTVARGRWVYVSHADGELMLQRHVVSDVANVELVSQSVRSRDFFLS
jgi:hypothetical protein